MNFPGPIAYRAAQDAIANEGVSEDGPPYENRGDNVERYLASVGLAPGNPWCAAFVNYRLHRAIIELGHGTGWELPQSSAAGAVITWANWAKATGRWFTSEQSEPSVGDLVCYDIESDGDHGLHHMGIVTLAPEIADEVHDFETVEGNTHPEGTPKRDGYCVAKRARSYDELGPEGGFIRLAF